MRLKYEPTSVPQVPAFGFRIPGLGFRVQFFGFRGGAPPPVTGVRSEALQEAVLAQLQHVSAQVPDFGFRIPGFHYNLS